MPFFLGSACRRGWRSPAVLDDGGGGHGIVGWSVLRWEVTSVKVWEGGGEVMSKVEGSNDAWGSRADQSNELFESALQAKDENTWVAGRSGRRLEGIVETAGVRLRRGTVITHVTG